MTKQDTPIKIIAITIAIILTLIPTIIGLYTSQALNLITLQGPTNTILTSIIIIIIAAISNILTGGGNT